MKRVLLLLFFVVFGISEMSAQDIVMVAGATQQYRGCSGALFFDSGGRRGDYGSNENNIAIFCPVIATDKIELNFSQLNLGFGDVLTIHDGNSVGAPVLSTSTNTTMAVGLIRASATNTSGCLTVRFTSNGSGSNAGWLAQRGCFNPCQAISPVITTTPATSPDGILRVCQGQQIDFNGTANFSVDGTGATYEWNLDDGAGTRTGQNQMTSYPNEGVYFINYKVTDADGCSDREDVDLVVQVSTDPDFNSSAADTDICLGETTTITGSAQSTQFQVVVAPPVAGTTFLPDGSGVSYQTCINVDLFPPGSFINNASDLLNILINMEHSFIGDLEILLTSPSGQQVLLLPNPNSGGGTYLGIPIDVDSNLNPGTGFDYIFTEQPVATQTLNQYVASNNISPVPNGTNLLPESPFAALVGSPLNGQWCLTITDNIGSDNGYIFAWELNFNPSIIPSEFTFTPAQNSTRWLPDPTIISTNGETITVQPTTTGTVCYTYEFSDDFGCSYTEDVCINVNPGVMGAPPENLLICDTTGSITTIDLTQNDVNILNGLSPGNHTVEYYTDINDATTRTNPITNPANFTFTPPNQTIYSVLVENATGCELLDDFEVGRISFDPFTVDNLEQCGELIGYNLDGYVRGFLTPSLNSTDYNITYYTSQANAQSSMNPLATPMNYDQGIGVQEIFVRVDAASDPTCNVIESFIIDLEELQGTGTADNIQLCDDLTEDGTEEFDLTQRENVIINTLDPSIYTATYHENQADADGNINAIANPAAYDNTSSPQTIYVRVTDNNNATCYAVETFDIEVLIIPDIATPNNPEQCDDTSADGFEDFDLTLLETDVLNGLDPSEYTIGFFPTRMDAEIKANQLITPYTNTAPTEDIFVCVENNTTGCVNIVSFQITVLPVPTTGTPMDLEQCANLLTVLPEFDLTVNTADIVNGQSPVTVTYHELRSEADAGTNSVNATNYTVISDPQTIFYRIEFDDTGCHNIGDFVLRTVQPPTINTPADQENCDSGDGTASIDLVTLDNTITGGAAFAVSYHSSQPDAENGSNALPTNYSYSADETIFVRVEDTASPCINLTSFELIFNELPVLGSADDIDLNDDLSDDLVEVFDLTANDADILDTLNPGDFTISYYSSLMDAQNKLNALPSNYQNTISPQTIFVCVENNDTGCASITDFDLIVNPIPDAITGTTLIECDQDEDNVASFQLSENNAELRNNQTDVTITYYESQNNAENAINELDPDSYDNTSDPQTIHYRIEFDDTGSFNIGTFQIETIGAPTAMMPDEFEDCDSGDGTISIDLLQFETEITQGEPDTSISFYTTDDDAINQTNEVSTPFVYEDDTVLFVRVDSDITECVNFTTLNLLFNELPEPQLFNQFVLCVGPGGELLQGPVELTTGLDPGLFTFQWFLDGQAITDATDADYLATEIGNYEVEAIDSMTGCVGMATTNVRSIGLPENYDVSVLSENYDKTHNVQATVNSDGNYLFRLDDGPYVTDGLFENIQPGPHTVSIREASGCGEVTIDVFVFGYPDFFTPNGDGFNDRWNIVGGSQFPNTQLYIFDRYGKLVKQISADSAGWDGNSNGQPLPGSDYWFKIQYDDNGVQAEATGHFALKR